MGHRESGATGGEAAQTSNEEKKSSTQNTQYDQIGTEYLKIKTLSAAEPEVPSILKVLGEGEVAGARCLGMFVLFESSMKWIGVWGCCRAIFQFLAPHKF
jgi:hypothetical protein